MEQQDKTTTKNCSTNRITKFYFIRNILFRKSLLSSVIILSLLFSSCDITDELVGSQKSKGCDGQPYPDPSTSQYVLPYPVGLIVRTGLTNCSSSYHSAGEPDQYAFDFNMPEGTIFCASREGKVISVVESKSSLGGGNGNYVLIDHGDNTFAYYLHSPENGIYVSVGDTVVKGQILGVTGKSGMAGYPHLHFIVVRGSYQYPYSGVAISFKNANPRDKVLQSYTLYEALDY